MPFGPPGSRLQERQAGKVPEHEPNTMRRLTQWIDGRRLAALLTIVAASCSMCAQQRTTRNTPKAVARKPGVVSGRVFLITESGDLKPARLADVYLLWAHPNWAGRPGFRTWDDLSKKEQEEADNAAAVVWSHENLKAAQEQLRLSEARLEAARQGTATSESVECLEDLRTYYTALGDILKWSDDPKNANQLLVANADEEGHFSIVVPRPGLYALLARGRAGFNEAFWDLSLDYITVESGKETTVKVASPEKACLVGVH